ncbi:MAG: polysulfide reductase NrfD [Deltaproteobacteria bacterium]|nr:polysulfide reductase NrfD [Deltaproteobacteria bacterium]
MKDVVRFARFSVRAVASGSIDYYKWVGFLVAMIALGVVAYSRQAEQGLIATAMTDQVSWGAYIANFTFGVGLAAAAVMLVIPAYVYGNKPVKEIVFVGELMAISAVTVCLLFVVVDLGRPDRFWHLMPFFGEFNFPISVLAWDVVVLNGYLVINLFITGYLLYSQFTHRRPQERLYVPIIFVSMVWAFSLHTVTAFLYVGLGGRPFWNAAILAPRFLASAFVSGPALIILVLRAVRKYLDFDVKEDAIGSLARLLAVTAPLNLFLLGCELFTEFYPGTLHNAAATYLFFGLHGHDMLVPYIWSAIALNCAACGILIARRWVRRRYLLETACVMTILGIWTEKGMGLIVPGFVPSPLGEIVEYSPSQVEFFVSAGVWSVGALVLTLLLKIAVPIEKMHEEAVPEP